MFALVAVFLAIVPATDMFTLPGVDGIISTMQTVISPFMGLIGLVVAVGLGLAVVGTIVRFFLG